MSRKKKEVYGADGIQRSLSEELARLRERMRVAVTSSDVRDVVVWMDCIIEDVGLGTYD